VPRNQSTSTQANGLFGRAGRWIGGLVGIPSPASSAAAPKSPKREGRGAGKARRGARDDFDSDSDDEFERDLDSAAARPHIQEIKGLLLIGVSLWLAISMASYYRPHGDPGALGRNWGGLVGFYLANLAFMATGTAGLLFSALGLAWGLVLVARKEVKLPALRLLAGLCFVLSIAFVVQLAVGQNVGPSPRWPYGPGGWLALQATPRLIEKFGYPGLWILMPLVAVVAFMLATEMAFYPAIVALGKWFRERREQRGESAGRALTQWLGRLVLGLWDFLRGAGIGETARRFEEAEERALAERGVLQPVAPAKPSRGKRQHPIDEDNAIDEDEDVPTPEIAAVLAAATARTARKAGGFDQQEADQAYDAAHLGLSEAEREAALGAGLDDEDDDGSGAGPVSGPFAIGGIGDDETGVRLDDEDREPSDDDDDGAPIAIDPIAAEKQKKFLERSTIRSESRPLDFEPPTPPVGDWKLPPLELLEPPEATSGLDKSDVENQAKKLEQALASFRVDAAVVGAQVGPTVILFELEVSQGTRMNKVTQLSQEIAAALRAQSVRIIAPIPGKATIGIEVPNIHRRKVRISELVSQKAYDKKAYALPLFLGVDAEGQPIVEDLAKMPHLLIAGTTGSGKSVCINTILASFLMTRSPHDVQMILVDPKMVELQIFARIPHLMLPTVTDMRQATAVINWAVEKMEGRYELFQHAGVRNIKGYNALSEDELKQRMGDNWNEERTPRHVPYIVLVIDEFADLMMQSKKEAEQAITRLAQKSRAVGIHVILATQRPSTDVITGVIKGNLPTRIAFQVASKVDSRVILDAQGAEKLLGGGDMLYNPPSSSRIKRVQGALVEDHELQAVVDFVCQDSAQSFNQELVQVATGTKPPGEGGEATGFEDALSDPMWDDAVRVILKSKRGSASLLQRALGVGYTRASRLLDMMGEAGIVSDHKGSKAREVMMTLDQWEEMHGPSRTGGPSSSLGADDDQ
jgi:DNA segregation ATPase FtsK/SpoIIIE-like protein